MNLWIAELYSLTPRNNDAGFWQDLPDRRTVAQVAINAEPVTVNRAEAGTVSRRLTAMCRSLGANPATPKVIKQIIIYLVAFGAAVALMRQVRKPHRWIGRPFLWIMNRTHSALTDWGLEHAAIEKDFTILDVGCGGGRTVQKLASIAIEGSVYGVDYASGSVAASRTKNAKLINAGRVEIHHGSVSHLPFPDVKFDLVTAVETQYYWPDLINDMKEIRRTLKPGGHLVIIAETFSGGRFDNVKGSAMKLLGSNALSEAGQRELFSTAGYDEIKTFVEQRKGWICVVGRKPLQNPER